MRNCLNLAIEARAVGLVVAGTRILNDVNISLRKGERWAILGPNGSGKTSLVRLFAGYLYPSEGIIDVLNERFGRTNLSLLRARIGWVNSDVRYQIPSFMTAVDVVMAQSRGGLVLYGVVPNHEDVEARRQLAMLSVDHLADRRFSTLSTGERQKVLIARALTSGVELLLLDEPAIGLDPAARERFLDDLSEMFCKRPELTVVYVTHDVAEITANFDGVMILDRGRIVSRGTPSKVLTNTKLGSVFGSNCRVCRQGDRFLIHFVKKSGE